VYKTRRRITRTGWPRRVGGSLGPRIRDLRFGCFRSDNDNFRAFPSRALVAPSAPASGARAVRRRSRSRAHFSGYVSRDRGGGVNGARNSQPVPLRHDALRYAFGARGSSGPQSYCSGIISVFF
jgi:hypothetical protein